MARIGFDQAKLSLGGWLPAPDTKSCSDKSEMAWEQVKDLPALSIISAQKQ